MSRDGQWLAYRLAPVEGDSQLVLRSTRDETEYRFDIGELPAGGRRGRGAPVVRSASLAFSADGRYLAFTTYPTHAERKKATRQRESGRERGPQAGAAPNRRQNALNGVGLVEGASGEQLTFKKVRLLRVFRRKSRLAGAASLSRRQSGPR